MNITRQTQNLMIRAGKIGLIVLVVTGLGWGLRKIQGKPSEALSPTNSSTAQVKGAEATVDVNHAFQVPISEVSGEPDTMLTFTIESAEKRDEIMVKGQKATAINGRTFLILNLKINNNSTKGMQVNTRDYIRLAVDGKDEWLAPDIHNDPVEVQAISTKFTRVGFPIDDNVTQLTVQTGEIKAEKQQLPIVF